jgi:hypothetical protein
MVENIHCRPYGVAQRKEWSPRTRVDDARTEERGALLTLVDPRREGCVGGKSRSRGVGD